MSGEEAVDNNAFDVSSKFTRILRKVALQKTRQTEHFVQHAHPQQTPFMHCLKAPIIRTFICMTAIATCRTVYVRKSLYLDLYLAFEDVPFGKNAICIRYQTT